MFSNSTNEIIRNKMMFNGVRQYELADELNMSESGICRKLRKELSDEDKEIMLAAIKAICDRRAAM